MPYDEDAAKRVHAVMKRRKGFEQKKMFGGIGYLLHGNMCCGVWKEFLILRVGPHAYEAALGEPGTREFDITGRAMKGWLMVEPESYEEPAELKEWTEMAVRFCQSLPPK